MHRMMKPICVRESEDEMHRDCLIFVEAILDNEEFCNFVEYMMSNSKTTQDPMLPLCKFVHH